MIITILISVNEIYFPIFICFKRPRTTARNVNNFPKIVMLIKNFKYTRIER